MIRRTTYISDASLIKAYNIQLATALVIRGRDYEKAKERWKIC